MRRILFVFGTRPEAIKLCPVIRYLRDGASDFDVSVCVTGQHRDLLDQVLEAFAVEPEYDLNLMTPGQTLFRTASQIISSLEPVLHEAEPEMVVVQGDTTTTFAGALAAFYSRLPVAHVEAGLRTGDPWQPFPEEMNRVLTTKLARLHFAPTEGARQALLRENVPADHIVVTGNSGIDALLHVSRGLSAGVLRADGLPPLDPDRKTLLVTAHRRESFGSGLEAVCDALRVLAARPDVQIVFPVHPNPNVKGTAGARLSGLGNVYLIDPVPYVSFVELMRQAYMLITDSGGIQEEGPSLGKPILVLRQKTERPEAVEAGTVKLIGTDRARIVREAELLLDTPEMYRRLTFSHNPYGDGRASERITEALQEYFAGAKLYL